MNWWKVGIGAVAGAFAGFMGGAGAKNTKAINSAANVQKATKGVEGVIGRFAGGNYYSSLRYAQATYHTEGRPHRGTTQGDGGVVPSLSP